MKINILWTFVEGPYGGGNQFLLALRERLRQLGLYEESPLAADVVIFNSFPHDRSLFPTAWKLKKCSPNLKLVHRIDGPMSIIRGTEDTSRDIGIYYFNKLLADGSIFQSQWSLERNKELGFEIGDQLYKIIINAPNPSIFYTKRRSKCSTEKIKIIASSWSSNMRKGFEDYRWMDENIDFSKYEMIFIGNTPVEFQNIKAIPAVPQQELGAQLRANDMYVSASRYEACSNAVLEAIHCGLPALCFNGSSQAETLQGCGATYNHVREIPELLEVLWKMAQSGFQETPASFQQVVDSYIAFCRSVHEMGRKPKTCSSSAFQSFLSHHAVDQTRIKRISRQVKSWLWPKKI